MNLLSLISPWLDIICQITTKCATVSKPKLFHQLNTSSPTRLNISIGVPINLLFSNASLPTQIDTAASHCCRFGDQQFVWNVLVLLFCWQRLAGQFPILTMWWCANFITSFWIQTWRILSMQSAEFSKPSLKSYKLELNTKKFLTKTEPYLEHYYQHQHAQVERDNRKLWASSYELNLHSRS